LSVSIKQKRQRTSNAVQPLLTRYAKNLY